MVERRAPPARAGARSRAADPPEGRHRHAPGRRGATTTRSALAKVVDAPPGARAGVGVDALRGGRRARRPVHRAASSSGTTPCSTSSRPRASRCRIRHAANSAGAIAHPAQPLRPGPLRHRRLRHPARPRRSPAPSTLQPAVRLVTEVSLREAGRRGRGHLLRAAPPRRARHRGSPRCPSATPTACSGALGLDAAGGAHRRAPVPDGRRRDHGPADGRRRARQPRSRAGDEVVLLGAQGDERITPDEWAAASAPSPTRSSARSAPASSAATSRRRYGGQMADGPDIGLADPRHPRLPEARGRLQGHHPAARPTRPAFARRRRPARGALRRPARRQGRRHRGARLRDRGRARRSTASAPGSCRCASPGKLPWTIEVAGVRARVRHRPPRDPHRRGRRPASGWWSSTTCSPPAARRRPPRAGRALGGEVVGLGFVIELAFLGGAKLGARHVSLLTYE